jgi:ATP-dependent Clp protease ATP-binding subunit ClpC
VLPENLSLEVRQILDQAKIEAEYSHHFYLGTEHLLIALTKIEYGVTWTLLKKFGFDPQAVRGHLRNFAGIGDGERYWEGFRITPRCDRVFEVAAVYAKTRQDDFIREKDILMALLKEESLPLRMLQKVGIPIDKMMNALLAGEAEMVTNDTVHDLETPNLHKFGRDLTALAKEGKLELVIGRDKEILKLVRILSRRTKNNPLLIGEPGVGKTSIVEGLAEWIVQGKLPRSFPCKQIVELKLSSILAGTQYRGEFEQRMEGIISESKQHPEVFLFLDEIHNLIGMGKCEGGNLDGSNFIKPALSRGEIRCIGATTIMEYHKYMEKDPALERRFHPVIVAEPTVEETIKILRQLREPYEKHFGLKINDSAIEAAVRMSVRYLPDRNLPDKALDIFDDSFTLVKFPKINISSEKEEKAEVTSEHVAIVISEMTGIPLSQLNNQEKERWRQMANIIKEKVIGQDEAVDRIVGPIKTARAGLKDANRPIGVFLFLGPTGVGKTMLARTISEFLFRSEKALIRLDMSEFMEKNSVAKLIGPIPGYAGYGEEDGQLTGKLRAKPYSVVLLDEIEKANPEIFDLFLQVFDEGRLTDSNGRVADARNAIFIMTSNIGTEYYSKRHIGFVNSIDSRDTIKDEIPTELKKNFRPEFLNRIDDVILFQPLDSKALRQIARNLLYGLEKRLEQQGITADIEETILDLICDEGGFDPLNGARPLARAIEHGLTLKFGEKLLAGQLVAGDKVSVSVRDGKIVFANVKEKKWV